MITLKYSTLIGIICFLQDEKDLVRSLATTMESTEGTEGDEYLHPKSRHPHGTSGLTSMSSTSGSPPPTPIKPFWPPGSSLTSDGSCAPQNRWNQELLRYAAQSEGTGESIPGTLSSDGSTRRYCSDPLKMLGVKDDSEDCFDSGLSKSQAQVGSLKLTLPLDEDDYLMPSPQQNQPGTAYIDLIGDSKHADMPTSSSGYRSYPDFLPHVGQTNIDNPEYIMSQEPVPTQTLGIPNSEMVEVANSESPTSTTAQNPPTYQPQRSSEEESDHEYYNDFDRLQRELQPLRKSETTV